LIKDAWWRRLLECREKGKQRSAVRVMRKSAHGLAIAAEGVLRILYLNLNRRPMIHRQRVGLLARDVQKDRAWTAVIPIPETFIMWMGIIEIINRETSFAFVVLAITRGIAHGRHVKPAERSRIETVTVRSIGIRGRHTVTRFKQNAMGIRISEEGNAAKRTTMARPFRCRVRTNNSLWKGNYRPGR
jgi:hypothetical protein